MMTPSSMLEQFVIYCPVYGIQSFVSRYLIGPWTKLDELLTVFTLYFYVVLVFCPEEFNGMTSSFHLIIMSLGLNCMFGLIYL
jgi:hypothetical protein